ncbi:MAG: DUF3943 domain-containing protein [Candidatus Dadabacteria bacterium]|nr:DUF3943 domain-containing protein [Candidatus Dadabacteria bacterium]
MGCFRRFSGKTTGITGASLLVVFCFLFLNTREAQSQIIYSDNIPRPLPTVPINESAFIDITDYRKPSLELRRQADTKSLADFGDFLRNTRNVYFTLWLVRIAQVNMMDNNSKENQMLINPVRWWKNFFGFQNDGKRRGDFKWEDGDRFTTNWIAHPAFGAYSYLYYRAKGYDRFTSAFGSVVQSTLFEYTIEGVIQSPSVHDLVITPGLGVPAGIVLEETSNWLESTNSGFLRAVSYVINPVKIIVPDKDNVNVAPLVSGQVVIGFHW